MKVYRNLNQIMTLAGVHQKRGRHLTPEDLSLLTNAAIVFDKERIHWVGADQDLPPQYQGVTSFDLSGFVLTPTLVDSHTHLVFAGNRAQEYALRLNGIDYQVIAQKGGGILHTVQKTLTATGDELFNLGVERLQKMEAYGVRAVEIKSGYALTEAGELHLLQIIDRLKKHFQGRMRIFSTYMGAHAVPKIFSHSSLYVSEVVLPTLVSAQALGLIDAVDVFHEGGYFDAVDTEKIFQQALKLGLHCKLHADEFQDNQGAQLAVKYHSLSADHLLRVGDEGIRSLAESQTVATLLPGTAFFLGKDLPRAEALLAAGCQVAIASDYNPGSSHVDNLLLVASLAAPTLKMNLGQLWAAITYNGARALGYSDLGVIQVGFFPLFSLFKVSDVAEITYGWGQNFSHPLP